MEYSQLKDTLKSYMTEENIEIVDKYYIEATKIFENMTRLTKEPYITHPIRVAKILADLKMDALTIGCALIHEGITLVQQLFYGIFLCHLF